ncbi:hypothetical protein [Paenibacillus eucommiae]|uniref:Transposase n=1 Tax=Paenibacillus eucommiae TaxID=1355755 RepID=A0ABS4IY92_9BACL|nr:hypothetical protein [Paenibacillus eucommiae]MBP1991951.1 hypothetical protein [Paenibacillus eucommiae]
MPVKIDLKRLEQSIFESENAPVVKDRILFYDESDFTRWKPECWAQPRLESVLPFKSTTHDYKLKVTIFRLSS